MLQKQPKTLQKMTKVAKNLVLQQLIHSP